MIMGLFTRHKPKIKVQETKKDSFSGWVKCTHCHELIHANELQENQHCCPKCDYHYRLSALQRVEMLVDKDTFEEKFTEFIKRASWRAEMKNKQEVLLLLNQALQDGFAAWPTK